MNKEDEIALEASISDWEKKRDGIIVARLCPLCVLARTRSRISGKAISDCDHCIIGKQTLKGCGGTPWSRNLNLHDYHQQEIDFLKSLRPKKGETMNKGNMVLDDKARTAVKASLDDKWRGIKGGTVVDQGQANCALCKEYRVSRFVASLNCTGCPIHAKTGKHGCEDTPFHKWHKHQSAEHKMCKERIIHCSICAEIVDEGIAFLEGLLKVEDKPVFHIDPAMGDKNRLMLQDTGNGEIAVRTADGWNLLDIRKDGTIYRYGSIGSVIPTDSRGRLMFIEDSK